MNKQKVEEKSEDKGRLQTWRDIHSFMISIAAIEIGEDILVKKMKKNG